MAKVILLIASFSFLIYLTYSLLQNYIWIRSLCHSSRWNELYFFMIYLSYLCCSCFCYFIILQGYLFLSFFVTLVSIISFPCQMLYIYLTNNIPLTYSVIARK